MIKHHTMAIEISRLAKTRASRSDVKALAETMTKDQTKEIEELKSMKTAAR